MIVISLKTMTDLNDYNNIYRPKPRHPKDLGVFKTLVTGWEQVSNARLSPSRNSDPRNLQLTPLSPIASYGETSSGGHQHSQPPSVKSRALKEAFLNSPDHPPLHSPASYGSRSPGSPFAAPLGAVTPTHRYASVESRLSNRQKIYEIGLINKSSDPLDPYKHEDHVSTCL